MQDHSIIPVGYCQCGCGQLTKIAPQSSTRRGWFINQPMPFVSGHHKRPILLIRFWSHVDTSGNCWVWTGATDSHGYGHFRDHGVTYAAHRFSYCLTYGPMPENKPDVLHTCDNPPCCRPEHLFAGTNADNNRDAAQKGRSARGERNGHAKLTAQDVQQLRQAYIAGETQTSLSSRLNMAQSSISAIVRRRKWKHL